MTWSKTFRGLAAAGVDRAAAEQSRHLVLRSLRGAKRASSSSGAPAETESGGLPDASRTRGARRTGRRGLAGEQQPIGALIAALIRPLNRNDLAAAYYERVEACRERILHADAVAVIAPLVFLLEYEDEFKCDGRIAARSERHYLPSPRPSPSAPT